MNSTSERIKKLIKEQSITQYRLAKAIGAPLTTVNGWFRRDNEPRDTYMQKIAEFLGVSPAYLRYGTADVESTTTSHNSDIIPLIAIIPDKFPSFIGKWTEFFKLPGIEGEFFAIHMPDNSMSPDIKKGDLIIFQPYDVESTIQQGDYVITKDKLSMPTVRRWGYSENQEILVTSNVEYRDEPLVSRSMIFGIVEEVWERKVKRGTPIS